MDEGQSFSEAGRRPHRHPAAIALIAIVFLETAALVVATVASAAAAVEASDAQRGSSIALAVTVGLFALGLGMLGWGLLIGRKHLLGGVLTWQVLQIACAIFAFQGLLGPWWIGWLLLVPGLAGLVLSCTKPLAAAYARAPKTD